MSETFLILGTTKRDVIKYVYWSSCTLTIILDGFEFSRQIFEKKNPHISNFMIIRPVGAGLFHAERQMD